MRSFHLAQAAVLTGLVSHGSTRTLPDLNLRALERRDQLSLSYYDEVCRQTHYDDSDPAARRALWFDTGAARFLDGWIMEHGEQDWLNRLDEFVSNDGLPNKHCDEPESACAPPESCKEYFDLGYPQAYYIFTAVSVFHELVKTLHERIQDDTILTSLQIPRMLEDFKVDEPRGLKGLTGKISAALIILSGMAGSVGAPGAIGGAMGIMIGVFSLVPPDKPEEDHGLLLYDQLAQIFAASQEQIKIFLHRALRGIDTDLLPMRIGLFEDYMTNIGAFFGDGKFILKDPGHYFEPILDGGLKAVRSTLVTTLLKANGYFVFINTDIFNKHDCQHENYGALWLDDECYDLFKLYPPTSSQKGRNLRGADADDDITNLMVSKYHIDLEAVYRNAMHCAKLFPDGHQDEKNEELFLTVLEREGQTLPVCFYDIPVVRGRENEGYIFDVYINTSGRPPSQAYDWDWDNW